MDRLEKIAVKSRGANGVLKRRGVLMRGEIIGEKVSGSELKVN